MIPKFGQKIAGFSLEKKLLQNLTEKSEQCPPVTFEGQLSEKNLCLHTTEGSEISAQVVVKKFVEKHIVGNIFQEDLKISPIFDGLFFDSPNIPGTEYHGMLPCSSLLRTREDRCTF